jgi:hypothetical protein
MPCESLITIEKSCLNNTGGIRTVWIAPQDEVTVTEGTWQITTATLTNPAAVYAINRNTGNYTEDTAQDLLTGNQLVTQTITLMFNRRDKDKSEAIHVLGAGQQYLAVFIEDANGLYWYFENAQLTATGEGSGTARADGSKYSITLLSEAEHLSYEILSTVITDGTGPTDFPAPTQS